MRAIFHPFTNLKVGDHVTIQGERAHHLHVVRVKVLENLKVINGQGQEVLARIESITKNNIDLLVIESRKLSKKHHLSLAVALPKKDAFEDILKISVELGINEIFPLSSHYSQYEFSPSERMDRIIESAMVQSNNSFLPVIHPQQFLSKFISEHSNPIAFFNSKLINGDGYKKAEKYTVLIGPEGGFSDDEVDLISTNAHTFEIHLPTPILRAPTAVASSVGYLLAKN